jgi:hypothetical protein
VLLFSTALHDKSRPFAITPGKFAEFLSINPLEDLFSVDRHALRRRKAQSHAVLARFEHGNDNISTDHDALALFST